MDFQFSLYLLHLCVSVNQTCTVAEFCQELSPRRECVCVSVCLGPARLGLGSVGVRVGHIC